MVLNSEDDSISERQAGSRIIKSELVRRVCLEQKKLRIDGGVGFDLRIYWCTPGDRDMTDLLIVDDRECCSIETYGHGRFGDLEVCVNPVLVASEVLTFGDLWTASTPSDRCLGPVTGSS
jgi:hypothetical protein